MKDRTKKDGVGGGKRAEADRELDEALEESFPASDPLPTTGAFAGGPDGREGVKPRRRRRDPEQNK
ncbi:MAG: hypothetical protein JO288_15915 [Hyphomicrobiales bacterium]|nr:hypothetical protein [Hyphomicrobiales bacterium]